VRLQTQASANKKKVISEIDQNNSFDTMSDVGPRTAAPDATSGAETCGICRLPLTDRVTIQPCNHEFDLECICEWIIGKYETCPTCPACRAVIIGVNGGPLLKGIETDDTEAPDPPDRFPCQNCPYSLQWPHQKPRGDKGCCQSCGGECKIHGLDLTKGIPCLKCERMIPWDHWKNSQGCCRCRTKCVFHGPGSQAPWSPRLRNIYIPIQPPDPPDHFWHMCLYCPNRTYLRSGRQCNCCEQCGYKCGEWDHVPLGSNGADWFVCY